MSEVAASNRSIITVLEPSDEYTHEPDAAENYNESMYVNTFDLGREIGGWFRLGNRVNEGYAEMTVCLYLPGGRVAFAYGRPRIENNDRMSAGGLTIEVLEPFEQLSISYEGDVSLLDQPRAMANPRKVLRESPHVEAKVELSVTGISPMFGGRPVYDDGTEIEQDATASFAKAHYEQHVSTTGLISVGDEHFELDGLGLRDKSWGPRYWQAVSWYRWLPMVFGEDFAMMLSVVGRGDGGQPHTGGMVLVDGAYQKVRDVRIEADWDDDGYHQTIRASCRTDERTYEVTGQVLSLIPLRNRRTTTDGDELMTRITEAMTRFECDGRVGMGMSEYLDQIVDDQPIGPR